MVNVKQTADQQVLGQVAGLLQQLNRNSRQVGINSGLSSQSGSNFVSTVATRALRGQQVDVRNGIFGSLPDQVNAGGEQSRERISLGTLLEQGLSVPDPDAVIDLEAEEDNAETEVNEDLLLQTSFSNEIGQISIDSAL